MPDEDGENNIDAGVLLHELRNVNQEEIDESSACKSDKWIALS